MEQAIPILVIALFIAWLIVEFQAGRAVRIGLGVVSIAGVAVVVHYVAAIIPSYERQLHRASLRELGEIAESGDLQRVRQALSAYNATAGANGSTYAAAVKMWDVVSHKPKPPENQ